MEATIFVQIASYRDPELVPTLIDLAQQANAPGSLRIVVCWQHTPEETLGIFWQRGFSKWRFKSVNGWTVHFMEYGGAKIELIDVPHLKTEGACWARSLAQQHYCGERYTLMLDSHHRFTKGWDRTLIDMVESLRDESAKPVLSTYLPHFTWEEGGLRNTHRLLLTTFEAFCPNGILRSKSKWADAEEMPNRPLRSRFCCAHFVFADGHFADVVQFDPELFFYGDEIAMAVRAFTHGYDLYSPHRLVAWHDSPRPKRIQMWYDHNETAKEIGNVSKHWGERDAHSVRRIRKLLGVDGEASLLSDFGRFGLGSERTLAEYEAYAGVSFRYRAIQQATLDDLPPVPDTPLPLSETNWRASLLRYYDLHIHISASTFDQNIQTPGLINALAAAAGVNVVVRDTAEEDMHSQELRAQALVKHRSHDTFDFHAIFLSKLERTPAYYIAELIDDVGNLLAWVKQPLAVGI